MNGGVELRVGRQSIASNGQTNWSCRGSRRLRLYVYRLNSIWQAQLRWQTHQVWFVTGSSRGFGWALATAVMEAEPPDRPEEVWREAATSADFDQVYPVDLPEDLASITEPEPPGEVDPAPPTGSAITSGKHRYVRLQYRGLQLSLAGR